MIYHIYTFTKKMVYYCCLAVNETNGNLVWLVDRRAIQSILAAASSWYRMNKRTQPALALISWRRSPKARSRTPNQLVIGDGVRISWDQWWAGVWGPQAEAWVEFYRRKDLAVEGFERTVGFAQCCFQGRAFWDIGWTSAERQWSASTYFFGDDGLSICELDERDDPVTA